MPLSANALKGLHWFFTTFPSPVGPLPQTQLLNDTDLIHHLKTVMRLRSGAELILVDEPTAQAFQARVEQVESRSLQVTLLGKLNPPAQQGPRFVAAVALIKGPRWDWLLQKLTELGIDEIIPLQTQRTVIDVKDKTTKQSRWHQILKHASEQSERVTIPVIGEPVKVKAFASAAADEGTLKLVALERSESSLSETLNRSSQPYRQIRFAIGPEGGWDEAEIRLLHENGFQSVSLGDKILRSETAAMYLTSVLDYVTRSSAV